MKRYRVIFDMVNGTSFSLVLGTEGFNSFMESLSHGIFPPVRVETLDGPGPVDSVDEVVRILRSKARGVVLN